MEISIALPQTGKFASPESIGYAAEEAERRGYPQCGCSRGFFGRSDRGPSAERPSPPCRSLMLTYMTHLRH